jgi:hypothetical protein
MSLLRSIRDAIFGDQNLLWMLGLLGAGGVWMAWRTFANLTPKQFARLHGPLLAVSIAAVLLALGVVAFLYWRNWRQSQERRAVNERVAQGPTYLLLPRAGAKPAAVDAVQLWDRVIGVLPAGEHLAWEISGNGDGQQFSLHASAQTAPAVLTQVAAEWPDAEYRPAGDG